MRSVIEMPLAEKRVKTFLLAGVALMLAFQWPPGPGNTKMADIALVLAIIYVWTVAWKHRQMVRFPLILPVWLILLGSLLATIQGLDRTASITSMIQDVYVYVLFLSLANMIDNEADLRLMMKIWVLMAAFESILMLATKLGIPGFGFLIGTHQLRLGEATGTIGQPNLAGAYLMQSLFMIVALRYPQRIWLRFATVVLIFFGMFATRSTGSLAGGVMGLLVILVYQTQRWTRSWLPQISATAFVGAAICLVFITSLTLGARISTEDDGLLSYSLGLLQEKLERRTGFLGVGWEAYLGHPLGVGPNAFSEAGPALGQEGGAPTQVKSSSHLHNDYVAYLVERGPLGMTGMLLLLVEMLLWVRFSIELTKHAPEKRFEVLALGIGLVASLTNGFVYEVMHWRHHWLFFALVFAQYKLLSMQAKDSDRTVWARDNRLSARPSAGQTA